jgi:hypothetical protein
LAKNLQTWAFASFNGLDDDIAVEKLPVSGRVRGRIIGISRLLRLLLFKY